MITSTIQLRSPSVQTGGRRGQTDLSVSSSSHLQHLTAGAALRPERDPGRSQAWCGVTRCGSNALGACLHQMTPEPGWPSDIGKDDDTDTTQLV